MSGMRRLPHAVVTVLGCAWLAAPAAAQGLRTITAEAATQAIPITTQVRHTTTVVLPREEAIVDVVAGDAEFWDVSASAHVAYVKPLEAGIASNVTLVAASGQVWALLVIESSDADPDLVVYVDGPASPAPAVVRQDALNVVSGRELLAHQAEEQAALAERQAIEEATATEVAAIWAEHDAAQAQWETDYPRQLRFPYRLDLAAAAPPFAVDAIWHDGRFTYLRTRAQELPALYEQDDTEAPRLVSYDVVDDGLYVTDHVLGAGRLQLGDAAAGWTLEREARQPRWTRRTVVGGIAAAVAVVLVQGLVR